MTAHPARPAPDPRPTGPPVALVDGRVHLLGGSTPIADNFAWRDPSHDGRQESFNAYAVLADTAAVLIETGVALHRAGVLRQIDEVVGDGRVLAAVVGTRLEPDCFSNLPAIVNRAPGRDVDVFAPGGLNPLDFFDDLNTEELMARFGVRVVLLRNGTTIDVAPGDELEVRVPSLRTLSTGWIHDPASATLFTSDCFSHYSTAPGEARVVGEGGKSVRPHTGEDLQAYVTRHHLTKFDWLRRADVSLMIHEVEQLFAERAVRMLAPTRGCAIRGEEAVRQNVDALLGMLRAIKQRQPQASMAHRG